MKTKQNRRLNASDYVGQSFFILAQAHAHCHSIVENSLSIFQLESIADVFLTRSENLCPPPPHYSMSFAWLDLLKNLCMLSKISVNSYVCFISVISLRITGLPSIHLFADFVNLFFWIFHWNAVLFKFLVL